MVHLQALYRGAFLAKIKAQGGDNL